MRGTRVIAKDYKGIALVRRVWEVGEAVVCLADESNYHKLATNGDALPPIGFPKEDVFHFESSISEGQSITKDTLKPWRPMAIAK